MSTLSWDERADLARQYAPHLVLFPEDQNRFRPGIEKGKGDTQIGENEIGDYYPRGVGPLIERSTMTSGLLQPRRPASLDELARSTNPHDQLLLLDRMLLNPDYAWQRYFEILNSRDQNNQSGRDRYPVTAYAHVMTRAEAIEASKNEQPPIDPSEIGRPFYKPNTAHAEDVVLQYWFCYYFDDWANVHEGDWEGIAIYLGWNGSGYDPLGACYYEHETGTRRHWAQVERSNSNGKTPRVHVAAGSHASYFQYVPEGYFTSVPGFIVPVLNLRLKVSMSTTRVDRVANAVDHPPTAPQVEVLPDPIEPPNSNDPALQHKKWLKFQGAWGTRVLGGFAYGGPTGPSHKGLKWDNPFAWMERNSGPDYLVY